MPASSSQSRKTLGSGQLDARRNETPSPGADGESSPTNGKPIKRVISEAKTSTAAKRAPSRKGAEERRPRPRRDASVSSPSGSTTSGSSTRGSGRRRGKGFSIGDSSDESYESDSDDYTRPSRSRYRAGPDSSPADDSSGPGRRRPSIAARQQPPASRDPSRGRKPNRSRSRAPSKATTAGGGRPVREAPSPSSTIQNPPVPGRNGLLRRTMSTRELPSHRRESNAGQDGGRPSLKRAASHHNLRSHSHSRDLLQLGQERPAPPPLPKVKAEPEPEPRRRCQYPFESFMGEDPTLENKASDVVRSRSLSRSRPLTKAVAVASAAAAFARPIPPPPPMPDKAQALYPAASFIGEGAFRGALVSAPTASNSTPTASNSAPIEEPTKSTPPSRRSASTPPGRLRRAGTAPVGVPLTALQDPKFASAAVSRAPSAASTTRSTARSKRSSSTPPAPISAARSSSRGTTTHDASYLALGLIESEAAAKRTMQGLPQGSTPPSRRPCMYPFESYVGENPTAETQAAVRSKSIRVPAPATKKFATGPFVPAAAATTTSAASAPAPSPRLPTTAMYPASSFVGEDDVRKAASGADNGAVPKIRVLPDFGSAPSGKAAATMEEGGHIVASPAHITVMHVEVPRISLQALPSAFVLDEKTVFGDLADDDEKGAKTINKPHDDKAAKAISKPDHGKATTAKIINKPKAPAALEEVGLAVSDDGEVGQFNGSDKKSDVTVPSKGLPVRPARRDAVAESTADTGSAPRVAVSPVAVPATRQPSPVVAAAVQPNPFAAAVQPSPYAADVKPSAPPAPRGLVDLEKGLPTTTQPAAARSYDGNSIPKGLAGAAARAAPPALRTSEMSWFYNPGMGTKGPRAWKKRTWGLLAALLTLIIVIAVAVAVTQQQQQLQRRAWFNTYPDYARLNYRLSDNYAGANFFDRFNYYEGYDPTQGHVHYVGRPHAEQLNLTYATPSTAILRVDATVGPGDVPDASTGRFSVRLESKTQYDRGLFVFDVAHTPYGCGTWPALWLASLVDWPRFGEVDVMEATNKGDEGNLFSLHTTAGCEMKRRREMTGVARGTDCYNGTNSNQGCNVAGPRESYGRSFNARGGGVVALELRDEGIRMWQFARPDVPRDLADADIENTPDPASWGRAAADFPSTDCDVGAHFRNQSIIINITLCGKLTEAVWGSSGCPGTCVNHVSNNPDAFRDAFWQINGLRVYTAARS